MLRRLLIVVVMSVVGATAPARAWCEATCLAPVTDSQSHCPTRESAGNTDGLSANTLDACPVIEAARPTIPARLDVQAVTVITAHAVAPHTRTLIAPSGIRPHGAATVFERNTPLRI